MYPYAGVVVNNDSVQVDMIFTYALPEELMTIDISGYRVKIPFGKNNKLIDGYILELYHSCGDISNIKTILNICDDFPVLRETDIKLIKIMRERYLCTYLDCIRTILPSGTAKDIKNKFCDFVFLGNKLNLKFDKEPYNKIVDIVAQNNGIYTKNEISRKYDLSLSSVNTLIKHGFLLTECRVALRFNEKNYADYEKKQLNIEQEKVFNNITKTENKYFLIHGVTGSGKTEVYMHLVNNMLLQNKASIILVPEIALTPQMIERFKGRFGSEIAVFHSKLSEGERVDEWLRVKNGTVKVAVGARSAVFLPFDNLGLIIIDEEHELSYKSDSNPKYNAREIAEIKSDMEGCKVVLGSATPSIETYFRTLNKEIDLMEIKNRADNAKMPCTEVIDMREELAANNKSILSRKLYSSINNALANKEQIILFLNKRGFSSFISCRKCGFVFKCSSCDISLTYHNTENYLICHYCGKKQQISKTCPACGSKYVKHFGIGTEKVEEEIKKYFPFARTLRMDFDTTRKKDSYETIYKTFKSGNADILIGTQMIAKGLDFENVTLVGVLAADLSLNLPDYRSAERTFQLITQVSGRAGRGKKPGDVIIQTYNPENYSIICSVNNDYIKFYEKEIQIRREMKYPPYGKILCLNFSSKNENLLISNSHKIGDFLKNTFSFNDKIEMLGPCPCSISKIKDLYRWQILFKGDIDLKFSNEVKFIVYKLLKNVYNDIRVSIDINPSSLV